MINYTFKEFETAFLNTNNSNELCKLIAPLLINWKYKDKYGDDWNDIIIKCSNYLFSIHYHHFKDNFQVKKFSIEDKELVFYILRFLQRILFFSRTELSNNFNLKTIIQLSLSFDDDISIQAFKVFSLISNPEICLLETNLLETCIKIINLDNLKIEDFTYNLKDRIITFENGLQFYNQSKNIISPVDFFVSVMKKDIFYTLKRVYAFLVFKLNVKINGINKNQMKKFFEEIIEELKKFIIENPESEIKDEVVFCLDRLIIFIIHCKFDRLDILRYLDVETEQAYRKKIAKYDNNTKFENILSFTIFTKLNNGKEKIYSDLIVNKGNPDFDYSYLNIVRNSIRHEIACIEDYLVDINEFRLIIDNLETYTKGEDINVLRSIFKIISKIYYTNQHMLEPFETSTFLSKMGSLINLDKPALSECCIETCCYFMEIDPYNIGKICKNGKLLQLFEPRFWKVDFFGVICIFFKTIFYNLKTRKSFIDQNILKLFLDNFVRYNADKTKFLNNESIDNFKKMVNDNQEFATQSINYQFSYLFNRGKKNQKLKEFEIFGDVNFFRLFMFKNIEGEKYDEFLYESTEFTLDVFNKIILFKMPDSEIWIDELFKVFCRTLPHIFDLHQIPILYFLRKIVNLLPEINEITNKSLPKLEKYLIILEKYLFFVIKVVGDYDEDRPKLEYLKIYDIIANISMNLMPYLFKFRLHFPVTRVFDKNLDQIIKKRKNMDWNLSNILEIIWRELLFLVEKAMQGDDGSSGRITMKLLNQTKYSEQNEVRSNKQVNLKEAKLKEQDKVNLKEVKTIKKSLEFHEMVYDDTGTINEIANKFHYDLVNWIPKIRVISLYNGETDEYVEFLTDFLKNCIICRYSYSVKSFYNFITENDHFRNVKSPWTTEKIFETFESLQILKEECIDIKIAEEEVIKSFFPIKKGFKFRTIEAINKIVCPDNTYSEELQDKLVVLYLKYFNLKNEVNYKGAFEYREFIQKMIEVRNFSNFIQNNVIDTSIYLVNNIFINSLEYLKLYIFVLDSLIYKDIENVIELDEIYLDPKSRINNQEIFTEMTINLKNVPMYFEKIKKSSLELKNKIKYCISIIKYLSNRRIFLKDKFYIKVIKFATRSISENNDSETNFLTKCLIHHLLEGPYDIMMKLNLFDNHLITYNDFLDHYKVLGFANLNGLKAKFERKLKNKSYYEEPPYSDYKYMIDKIHKVLFKTLIRMSISDDNSLNLITEILINNSRYSKFITKKYIKKIFKMRIIEFDLKDKLTDKSTFEVGLKFIIFCLKTENTIIQEITLRLIKKALKYCANSKLYNIIIVLCRSLSFIDLKIHRNEIYVASTKENEMSAKYIKNNFINLIIERLINCTKQDLKCVSKNENFILKNIDRIFLNDDLNWNTYDLKIGYVYSFISKIYKTYNEEFPGFRKELWNLEDSCVLLKSDLSKPIFYDITDKLDFTSEIQLPLYEYKNVNLDDHKNIFRKVYTSYYLYEYEYKCILYKERCEIQDEIENLFKVQYNIENLDNRITEVNHEFGGFINKNSDSVKVDINIGVENGFKPIIDLSELNKMHESEMRIIIRELNMHRTTFCDTYSGIDVKFLRKCNNLQRYVFVSEEERLKDCYDSFGKPKFWPDKIITDSFWNTNKIKETSKPKEFSYKRLNYIERDKLKEELKYRFDNFDVENEILQPSTEFFSNLDPLKRNIVMKFEDKIAKIHALNLCKSEVEDKTIKMVSEETIYKFLDALSKNTALCHSNIAHFLSISFKNLENTNCVNKSLTKVLFNLCKKPIFIISDVKNALKLIFELREELIKDILEDIYYIRLLFIISRYPELCKFTLTILNVVKIPETLFTDLPLFPEDYNLNPDLICIKENDISKILFWNFKELLKCNISESSYRRLLTFVSSREIFPYLSNLICMCLQDKDLVIKSMKKISEICGNYFVMVESLLINEISLIKKEYQLPDLGITKIDFKYLLAKGVFNNQINKYIQSIDPSIYDCLHKILQNNDFSLRDFILLFETYEGFINLLIIMKTYKQEERIKQYSNLRSELEKKMLKDQDLYNELFQKDSKCASFLVKFNIITFTNKRKYFRDQIRFNNKYVDLEVFEIYVNKDYIVNDSYDNIMIVSPDTFKKSRIKVSFVDEDGYDAGGLTKEWLECLAKGVSNQNFGLFTYSSDNSISLIPFKDIIDDNLQYFKFIGRIMGKTILDGYNFPLNLDKTVYKFILNKKCDLSDLESVDPQFYNSLIWMKDNSIKDVLHLTFTYENNDFGDLKVEDLKPDGRNIPVTDANKNEYIELIIKKKFINNIYSQLNALKSGLLEIVDENLINIFDEKELELLICGVPEIDVEDWKRNTIYNNYTKNDIMIKWFWRAVSGFSSDEKAKLLHFCTGSSRVPFDGFANLQGSTEIQKFKIHKMNTKRLPTAHTCFNQLDLPEYSSYEELRRNIIYAINECHGTYGFA